MPSYTPDHQKIAGIKSFLRFKPLRELQELAYTIFSAATEEVTITGTAADGGSANGEVTLPKWVYLQAVMEVRQEMGDVPKDASGAIIRRDIWTRVDMSRRDQASDLIPAPTL